jgi:cysteinyl-tRNA synthetase
MQGLKDSAEHRRALAAVCDQFDGIFGVASLKPLEQQSTGIAVYLPGTTPSDEVETLLAQRRDAKKAKDFAASDAIRDRLKAMGYAIKDMPGGKVEVAPG